VALAGVGELIVTERGRAEEEREGEETGTDSREGLPELERLLMARYTSGQATKAPKTTSAMRKPTSGAYCPTHVGVAPPSSCSLCLSAGDAAAK
jgi:hypothetical protein